MEAVRKSLVNARILAAQMGCQRAVYQIDDDISIGNTYDDSRMTDAASMAESGEGGVVCCILSKGWVKKLRVGSGAETDMPFYICKAMVLVK
jgi:hypothetical protein